MINFLEAVKHQLHQFVETGHSKPVHLMQNQLINDIYHAIDHNQMVMLTSNQKTYKGYKPSLSSKIRSSAWLNLKKSNV